MTNRRLTRLKGYDYKQLGKYFITFNTKEKGNILGKIGIVGTGLDLSTKTM
ncbi:hypothetical protein KAU15_02575 [candidate division WOR-3 bacterium]|nr:hypothetical protein [candidate division WOR-3 bacterium]